MHDKIGKDRMCISGDMIADTHTDRETDTFITILIIIIIIVVVVVVVIIIIKVIGCEDRP